MRFALLLLAIGCQGKSVGTGDEEPDPKGWTITVDLGATDRFLQPESSTAWPLAGTAPATEGLATIDVAGAAASFADDGSFTHDVSVVPGSNRIGVLVRDQAGHERKAVRTLVATRLLPDGAHNAQAASLVLDDAILAAMSGGIAGQAGDVDVAAEIMAKTVLSQDDRCVTWPVSATQGQTRVELVEDAGNLWLHITVPSLDVR